MICNVHEFFVAPHKDPYAINRFTMEAKRQLDVLERQLGGKEGNKQATKYICGDHITIGE